MYENKDYDVKKKFECANPTTKLERFTNKKELLLNKLNGQTYRDSWMKTSWTRSCGVCTRARSVKSSPESLLECGGEPYDELTTIWHSMKNEGATLAAADVTHYPAGTLWRGKCCRQMQSGSNHRKTTSQASLTVLRLIVPLSSPVLLPPWLRALVMSNHFRKEPL